MESTEHQVLEWIQPSGWRRFFELRAGDEVIATMVWPKALSDSAVVESMHGRWRIVCRGFFKRRIIVSQTDGGVEIATYEANWRDEGRLTFSDGRTFLWRPMNFWRTRWVLLIEPQVMMYEMRAADRWFKYGAEVELHSTPTDTGDLILLLAIGWYVAYMSQQTAVVVASS